MLVLNLRAQFSGAMQDEHLFWAALFGWYVVHGPGLVSLDHLLSNGMKHSPLPLAELAIAVGDWVDRATGPVYVLAVRLWLAAACSETTKLDRFRLEFSAVIPWLGGAESDEGIEIFGGAEGVHSQAGR